MAGRATHRATLAARPAQAVPLYPASPSSPGQRHGTSCEWCGQFEALSFADFVLRSRFDLQRAPRHSVAIEAALGGDQVNDGGLGGARWR